MHSIWITWERQRRSLELAKKFKCRLYVIEFSGPLRYPKSIIKTLFVLLADKPDILFVQNPSMILASLACLYKFVSNTPLIVDRHTTFLLNKKNTHNARDLFFKLLSRFTIRCADITIITNDFLARLVKDQGGNPFVLPDMLPDLRPIGRYQLKGKYNLLVISSFAKDEPIHEVVAAGKKILRDETYLYVTGNHKKLPPEAYTSKSPNVVFTGFLLETDFINMLFSADAVIALTTADHCMLCGCYEAFAARKPLITSKKEALMSYFEGALFIENDADAIARGIKEMTRDLRSHIEKIGQSREKIRREWNDQCRQLEIKITKLSDKTPGAFFARTSK